MMTADAEVVDEAVECVCRLLGGTALNARVIRAGGNNRIVRVDRHGERSCAVKIYFRHPLDPRDRLTTEFGALSFLWGHGVRRTPEPLAADYNRGMAIYRFVEGERVNASTVGPVEIGAAVDLLAVLHDLRTAEGTDRIGPASEAFFSLNTLISNLYKRFQRHSTVSGSGRVFDEYVAFRDGPLRRGLEMVEQKARSDAALLGESADGELAREHWTLSPSDFGFHNALRSATGEIIFLDFEYFGWDDPAKTVCDFCYHPALPLRPGMRELFAASLIPRLGGDALLRRISRLFPIFGLKWCLILLNEFLPEVQLRRNLASGRSGSAIDLMSEQLAKAQAMFEQVTRERERDGFVGVTP